MSKKPEGSFSFPALDGEGNALVREAMQHFEELGQDESGLNRGAHPFRFHPVDENEIRTIDYKGIITDAQRAYVEQDLNGEVHEPAALEV